MEVDPAADERRKNKGGLEWELERHYDDLEREMMLMAADDRPHKQQRWRHRPDLLQNCDLPPPAKLFGPVPTLQRLETAAAKDDGLLRALRLSQSRAREAEDKLAAAGATNVDLAALLVRDSVALSAHRRWVMMLEAENSLLRGRGEGADPEPQPDPDHGAGGVAVWWVALAVCVGVGLALGRFLC
ncbi:uncharacterized protein LOC8067049 [Sorghum bicolor]|uniref:Uncharacterized protein n=1 Tax=Sorghum bicolor TaxID=4558 RepID=C5YJR9_SORBI|nr:uncharacterized protein LOC8067049 [Sorghum bicolor]EES15486.1 hypothetical protein SORBI_3007G227500 [Sorghum bicolor]|eukprot:XP_002445991.1 uncharacterized protein LOC8067049 [Sorghum bicolor]